MLSDCFKAVQLSDALEVAGKMTFVRGNCFAVGLQLESLMVLSCPDLSTLKLRADK